VSISTTNFKAGKANDVESGKEKKAKGSQIAS
jgi:hypothetical protein